MIITWVSLGFSLKDHGSSYTQTFWSLQLSCEIKHLLGQIQSATFEPKEEIAIDRGFIKKFEANREKMCAEDLAALDKVTEESIVEELKQRLAHGESYTFVGDVLLSLNSNEMPVEFPKSVSLMNLHLLNS